MRAEYEKLAKEYAKFVESGVKLDMSRGKPAPEMLELAKPLLDSVTSESELTPGGIDVLNYGPPAHLDGLPAAKTLMAEIMGNDENDVTVYGNSSLNLMYDVLAKDFSFANTEGGQPLSQCKDRKWLCLVPGYDRHFAITELFGFQMINIALHPDGPDMEAIEQQIKSPDVKGLWCVPMFSNPGGQIFSDAKIKRLASLKPAAPDFRIYCDNAYKMHSFCGEISQKNLLEAAKEAGNPDMVYHFASTSKISFAGAGICAMACSPANKARLLKLMSIQTIGHDKVNQLRHALYFDRAKLAEHMQSYISLLKPKFDAVISVLDRELGGTGYGSWETPKGGYFISFNTKPGLAKRTVQLCREAGLILTGAGATYPYGIDPQDENIRIAPSYPTIEQLTQAAKLFCLCVKMAALEE